ncbi:sigma factor G inhibitor Gin [Bacillus sp. JZ8]
MKTNHQKEQCMVCEEYREEGIRILFSFLCRDCEKEIVDTETNEVMYDYYVKKLKQMNTSKVEL